MGILKTDEISVGIAGTQVINVPGATRFDIEIEGTVNIVNRGGDVVDSITDTSKNFYWSSSFSIVGVTVATGRYMAIEDSKR